MPKITVFISIFIFSILLGITSAVKNQTRVIEKNIYKLSKKIAIGEKDLYETELDFYYLSSPNYLSEKVKNLLHIEYIPMDYSRIYLNYNDFIQSQRKISILKTQNEKKIQKK